MERDLNLEPVKDCLGCAGTAGRLGCPEHSPNVHISDQPKPYTQIYLQCPWCGEGIQMDCFKVEITKHGKII